MQRLKIFIIFSIILFNIFISCNDKKNRPAKGFLVISFKFNEVEGIEPSYQIAIWLESENEQYHKSLFVSEYLAYGGYNDSTICPDWNKVVDWENVSESEFDAVTSATFPVGENELKINCKDSSILPGLYRYFIQVHIVENYNVLCTGKINIGSEDVESKAKIDFIPDKFPGTQIVISNVKIEYYR